MHNVEILKEDSPGRTLRPVPLLDFSRQYAKIGPEILEAVRKVFETQHFILGEQVTAFERAAAAILQTNHAAGCSSGTDALWLALTAAEIGEGDAVITTPFSFFASVSSILRAGARPILADIEPDTFNLSPSAVEGILAENAHPRIRAIMPVHLYGQCADWDRFENLRSRFNVLLIEDAAQAWGAKWKNRFAGSLGSTAAFSFYPTKNLSASGDAGMVTTNDSGVAERLRMLRVHGMRQRYYHDEVGWNCRLDTLQAAVLLVKLKYIQEWNDRRRVLAHNYHRLFTQYGIAEKTNLLYPEHGIVLPQERPEANHVWHQYVIRVRKRNALRQFLTGRKIGSEIYYPVPLHLQECLKNLRYKAGDFPESERAAAEVLALPIFPELQEEEQEIVVSAISDFLNS